MIYYHDEHRLRKIRTDNDKSMHQGKNLKTSFGHIHSEEKAPNLFLIIPSVLPSISVGRRKTRSPRFCEVIERGVKPRLSTLSFGGDFNELRRDSPNERLTYRLVPLLNSHCAEL
ncbi:hypothetical protein CEXT_635461 [Caerostris extrusa]|uniref:Ycf15 n=1 Tax=Caerostris extrusa TaxID=172846 RepID=A0AAV4XM16_CAEEX|nr:hypothetical protein CEXT_635461 [Caerostris extrusa]